MANCYLLAALNAARELAQSYLNIADCHTETVPSLKDFELFLMNIFVSLPVVAILKSSYLHQAILHKNWLSTVKVFTWLWCIFFMY
jgi:hypothetical protein